MKKAKRTSIEPSTAAAAPPANELNAEFHEPNSEEIEALAHYIWEQQGRPEGRALEHWLVAEAKIRGQRVANTNVGSR